MRLQGWQPGAPAHLKNIYILNNCCDAFKNILFIWSRTFTYPVLYFFFKLEICWFNEPALDAKCIFNALHHSRLGTLEGGGEISPFSISSALPSGSRIPLSLYPPTPTPLPGPHQPDPRGFKCWRFLFHKETFEFLCELSVASEIWVMFCQSSLPCFVLGGLSLMAFVNPGDFQWLCLKPLVNDSSWAMGQDHWVGGGREREREIQVGSRNKICLLALCLACETEIVWSLTSRHFQELLGVWNVCIY